ncbi:MAG: YgcG family protein [Cyclobacteriaceae bacterium]
MRKIQNIFFLLLLITFGCNSKQSNTTDYSFANVKTELIKGRVNDYGNILTEPEESTLNELLKSLEDSIGSQLVILTIDSLYGETIESYSLKVADKKIGRASHNDGILILVSVKDRKVRIEVGYGLELIIKDEIAWRIINQQITPEFKKGNFFEGLNKGSEEIIQLIYSNPELVGKEWESQKK